MVILAFLYPDLGTMVQSGNTAVLKKLGTYFVNRLLFSPITFTEASWKIWNRVGNTVDKASPWERTTPLSGKSIAGLILRRHPTKGSASACLASVPVPLEN